MAAGGQSAEARTTGAASAQYAMAAVAVEKTAARISWAGFGLAKVACAGGGCGAVLQQSI